MSQEPEVRDPDDHPIRWKLVGDVATEVLRAARAKVGVDRSPIKQVAWDVTVEVLMPQPLTGEEARVVQSLFTSEAAVADHTSDQVTNGRHRMYFVWNAGAAQLPVQSASVSGWSHSLFGDPSHTTLSLQLFSCAYLYEFVGMCQAWWKSPDADIEFIDGLDDALEVASEFLDTVAADAARVDPSPRMQARS